LPWAGRFYIPARGQVVEWSMAPHSKCGVPARVPWVRIPPCPPLAIDLNQLFQIFARCLTLTFTNRKWGQRNNHSASHIYFCWHPF
jgi:hypothetical protein